METLMHLEVKSYLDVYCDSQGMVHDTYKELKAQLGENKMEWNLSAK